MSSILHKGLRDTTSIRARGEQDRLLLAIIRPHNPLSSSSIARWIKKSLTEVGTKVTLLTPQGLLQQQQRKWLVSLRRRS